MEKQEFCMEKSQIFQEMISRISKLSQDSYLMVTDMQHNLTFVPESTAEFLGIPSGWCEDGYKIVLEKSVHPYDCPEYTEEMKKRLRGINLENDLYIRMVKDHMCIFLDASSTAYTLGMKLTGFTELTVITNGIDLALALKDIPGITVILTGGIVTSASSSIEGLLGVDLLQKIHTDIAFVSARGFSVENGLTDFSIYEADLKRMCIKASAKTIALIDHTKFDTSSISSYASIDDLNLVITDSGLSENTKEIYEKAGVDLLIAD